MLHIKSNTDYPGNYALMSPEVTCCKAQFIFLSNISFFCGSLNLSYLNPGRIYYKTFWLYLLLIWSRPEYAWSICHRTLNNFQSINQLFVFVYQVLHILMVCHRSIPIFLLLYLRGIVLNGVWKWAEQLCF